MAPTQRSTRKGQVDVGSGNAWKILEPPEPPIKTRDATRKRRNELFFIFGNFLVPRIQQPRPIWDVCVQRGRPKLYNGFGQTCTATWAGFVPRLFAKTVVQIWYHSMYKSGNLYTRFCSICTTVCAQFVPRIFEPKLWGLSYSSVGFVQRFFTILYNIHLLLQTGNELDN